MIGCTCGANYCRMCIQGVSDEKKPCPLCNGHFNQIMPNRSLQRTINGLRVYCAYKGSGCDWEGELSGLSTHLNDSPTDGLKLLGCEYVQVACDYCGEMCVRGLVQEHEQNECSKRLYRCTLCNDYESTYEDYSENHVSTCPLRIMSCSNGCGEVVFYKDLVQHLSEDCPLETLACSFDYAGCEARVLRKDMSLHMSENVSTHMSLMALHHQKESQLFKAQIQELQKENSGLKRELKQLTIDQQLMEAHSKVVPVRLVFNNFSSRMINFKEWVSRQFYTHFKGYSLRLVVDPNGHMDETQGYVSVYIELICGKFDDALSWPFHHSVTVELVDQDGEVDSCVGIIPFNEAPIEHAQRVMEGSRNKDWGIKKFISHSDLNSKYLKNDSLVFKIPRVD